MTTTTEYMITDEDRVTIDSDGTIRAYTRGCTAPLYVGTDKDAAADSLEIDREMFADALMGDPSSADCRLTDAYRVCNGNSGCVLSYHQTYWDAQRAWIAEVATGGYRRERLTIEELVDGRWVAYP